MVVFYMFANARDCFVIVCACAAELARATLIALKRLQSESRQRSAHLRLFCDDGNVANRKVIRVASSTHLTGPLLGKC